MDCALYDSLHDLVGDECNMPRVCENASMRVNPHKCDDMLFDSMGIVDKLLNKNAKKFQKNLSMLFCEKDDLIAKLNESNKDRKSTRLNSSHQVQSRMPSSA